MNESQTPKPPGGTPPNAKPPQFSLINILIAGFIITFVLNLALSSVNKESMIPIEYSQFMELLDAGLIKSAQLNSEQTQINMTLSEKADKKTLINILTSSGDFSAKSSGIIYEAINDDTLKTSVYYTGLVGDPDLTDKLVKREVSFGRQMEISSPIMDFISNWVFPIIILYFIYMFVIRRFMKSGNSEFGGMMSVGKSKAKMYTVEKSTGVTFDDVAGQREAKESLVEMVDFLNSPEKYHKIGAKQPKGALLVGPPGTGKTLLAKAVAGEAGVPFFSLSGSEFVEMFVGVGASRVRDLFEQAKKHSPCIIFIDEIDAIGKRRDNQIGGNDEREQTLNQLLAEMDGFDEGKKSKEIVILAATNRPEILDKALLRPGRFDRRIIVEKPDLPGREAILRVHAAKVNMLPEINLKEIALATSGATGADLANMINEAALRAVRIGREAVSHEDLMESVEVVIAGKEKKDRILNEKEKRMVSFHEVGHAIAAAMQKNSQPVQKITIVPRTMGSLGYTMQMPEEERYLLTEPEMISQIVILLGGRAAEEIEFGVSTTGAQNDIERATKLARSMVTQYGMSEKFGMISLETVTDKYLEERAIAHFSEATGFEIDNEVQKIIKQCHDKAKDILTANKAKLSSIAEFLIQKESITGEKFMELLKQ